MSRDIFIDNSIAKNFCNPMDPEYKRLIAWLQAYDPHAGDSNAHLVVSNKLLSEYKATAASSLSYTNISAIIDKLTREGRIDHITNDKIKNFKRLHFRGRIARLLRCDLRDRDHLPVVLLSYRKYALSRDNDFVYDVNNFPGFNARAAARPQDLPYEQYNASG